MKRRFFNAGALVSLVLCVAVAALGARSYWAHDMVGYSGAPYYMSVQWRSGVIGLSIQPFNDPPETGVGFFASTPPDFGPLQPFQYIHIPGIERHLSFPHWLVCLAAAPLPIAWLARRLSKRSADGRCAACGYDLRGTEKGSPCPECGTARHPLA